MKTSTARARAVENEPTLDEARAARAEAETAKRAAALAVDAAVALWPAPNNQRNFIRGLYMGPAAANDYMQSEATRDVSKRLAAFKAAEAAEDQAQRALDHAIAVEAQAIRIALGDGRGALAEAIAAARGCRDGVDAAQALAERARGRLVQAHIVHDAAEAALAEAREIAIGAATTEDGAQPVNLKDFRRAVADAADDVDVASEAVRRAEAATMKPEDADRRAQAIIEAAARAVLYADFDERLAALNAMVAKFKSEALAHASWLQAVVPSAAWTSEKARDWQRANALIEELVALGEPIRDPHERGGALFSEALLALMQDAAVPLPEVP